MEKAVASRCGAGLIGWLRFEKVAGVLGDWRHMVAFVVSENLTLPAVRAAEHEAFTRS